MRRDLLESTIEGYLRNVVERELGGECIKLWPMSQVGIPDRLVLLPGRVWFIETKRPVGGRDGKLQGWWRDRLKALGFDWAKLRTKEEVDQWRTSL